MKKTKRLLALLLASAMILGGALSAHAASCSWVREPIKSVDHCTIAGPRDTCTNHGEIRCGLCGAIVSY